MCKFTQSANNLCNNARMNDWDDLRYFLAVARNSSVSGAAVELGVNHSTVSRRINAYEKKHDVRLFERLPQGYAMTQAAENIYRYALEIEERTQIVERELFGRDTRLQGRLCITSYHSTFNELVIPALHSFSAAYPEIDLELSVTADVRDLSAREADIAIRGTPQPPDHLIGKKVADFGSAIYTAESYQARQPRRPEVILWRDEMQLPEWAVAHFPDARVVLRVDDVTAMRTAVQAGLGMARLPSWVADVCPDLFRLKLDIPSMGWGLWVLIHADLRSTARVRVCRDFLIETLEKKRDLIEGRCSNYL
ncbi:MAG: LysR family transcriptional regulator [Gammaproteobacteria bacterium]|nr:LysR family transcriptional regulator [Gammaproteobacteria bacterium]MBQ0838208.1 LysR family transcriptional regulator [Gammaproteobacteria bacterium]